MRMNKRLTNYNHVKQTNRAWAWQAVIAFLYGSTPLRLYQINPRLLRSRLFGTWPQRRLNKPCPKLENKRQAWQCRRDCHPAARGGVVLQPFEYNKCVRFCPLNLFIKDSDDDAFLLYATYPVALFFHLLCWCLDGRFEAKSELSLLSRVSATRSSWSIVKILLDQFSQYS